MSGALFQTVWNSLTGRDPEYGIQDYDIIYYDTKDLSWEAENQVIRRLAEGFRDLSVSLEVRNQARVHLWYPEKYGLPYPALTNASESIDRYLAVASMVGLHPDEKGGLELYAPRGLEDIQSLCVRPNPSPNFSKEAFTHKLNRWKACWPEITCFADDTSDLPVMIEQQKFP